MSTITPYQPNLASALLSLASQTQASAPDTGASSGASTEDTLTLSSSASQDPAEVMIEEENKAAALADPAAALAANQSATSYIANQPNLALSAQSGAISSSVLNLI